MLASCEVRNDLKAMLFLSAAAVDFYSCVVQNTVVLSSGWAINHILLQITITTFNKRKQDN